MEPRLYKISLIILVLLLGANIFAQEVDIEGVSIVPNDDYARANPRTDANGDLCAVLKVIAPTLENMSFESNYGIIGNVKEERSIYYIYVPSGTRKLSFRHKDFLSKEVEFVNYGIKIKGGITYEVVLARPEVQGKTTVTSFFNVEPIGAQLKIDEKLVDLRSGYTFMELTPGTYHYDVSAKNHLPQKGTFVISQNEKQHTEHIRLNEEFASVSFWCNAKTPKLIIDEKVYSRTDNLRLPVGKHSIRVIAYGYKDYTGSINISSKHKNAIKAKLSAQKMVVRVLLDDDFDTVDNKPVSSSTVSVTTGRHLFQKFKSGKKKAVRSKVIKIIPEMNNQPISRYI